MNAHDLTVSLQGKWYGGYGAAACPVCQPDRRRTQTALTLADGGDGRLLAHCKRNGCEFRDIMAAAGVAPGTFMTPDPVAAARRRAGEMAQADRRAGQALRLWREARPIGGTAAEVYLRGRGITCPLLDTLRFVPTCWHPTGRRFPALLAMVQGCARFALPSSRR